MPHENPKEEAGRMKCPMNLLPKVFLEQTSYVLGHGATKYGEWNWRHSDKLKMSTYVAAIMRHVTAISDGELIDDSGFPHIAHIAASCAVVLDAEKHGNMHQDTLVEDGHGKLCGTLRHAHRWIAPTNA